MKNPSKIVLPALLASSLILISACDEKQKAPGQSKTEAAKTEQTAATGKDDLILVNGQPITKIDLQNALIQRSKEGNPTNPNVVLQEMVNLEVLRQEALKQGIDKMDAVKAEINRQTTAVLANELIRSHFKDLNITDEQIKQEYEQQITKQPQSEYKARHILLKTEDEAKAVIDELKNGADFATLAKEKSTGPSGKNGGDLGWFQPATMVKEFASAVKVMDKGKFSETPVQTQFGYHVILLEDTRVIPAPELDTVKDKIKTLIVNRLLQDYMSGLAQKADIKPVEQQQETSEEGSKS